LLEIAHKVGLFEACAKGPATSIELAKRANLEERYVREWLGAMTCAGFFQYEPQTKIYTLDTNVIPYVTGDLGTRILSRSTLITTLGLHVDKMQECFKKGGGLPFQDFSRYFDENMKRVSQHHFDVGLLSHYLPKAKHTHTKLTSGEMCHVLDIGCGSGYAVNLLARAFPNSTFFGIDMSETSINQANAESQILGLTNSQFKMLDLENLSQQSQHFDLIMAFDVVHELAHPRQVLKQIYQCLSPGGEFLMYEVTASSNLEENMKNPLASLLYGVSTLYCMTISLAQKGEGLGMLWGKELTSAMLNEAGFDTVETFQAGPMSPMNTLYLGTKLQI